MKKERRREISDVTGDRDLAEGDNGNERLKRFEGDDQNRKESSIIIVAAAAEDKEGRSWAVSDFGSCRTTKRLLTIGRNMNIHMDVNVVMFCIIDLDRFWCFVGLKNRGSVDCLKCL